MKRLPPFLKKYFWDTDFEQFDVQKYSKDVIGRILEYGDEKAVDWLRNNFTQEEIGDVLKRFRFVSPRSANFWAVVFGIPKEEIFCLSKHYLKTQRRHWPY